MRALIESVEVHPALAEADGLWRERARGAEGDRARPDAARSLVIRLRRAVAEEPVSVEVRWRLMRALYFEGDYAARGPAEAKSLYSEGMAVAEETLGLLRAEAAEGARKDYSSAPPVELVPRLAGHPGVASAFEWAAVVWGKWALAEGMLAAVRHGAAARIRDYAEALHRLDPDLDDAAADRTLGRLHHKTPTVPFLTGWVSSREALRLLRRSVRSAPTSLVNRIFLAEALWDLENDRRDEAVALAEAILADSPDPCWVVEHGRARADARRFLAAARS